MKSSLIVSAGILAAFVSIPALAGDVSLPNGPYLIADGSATYDAAPDTATLQFSLSKTAPTTAAASDALDSKTLAVFKVLRDFRIPDKDIRASSVSVSPQYDYRNGKQVYTGEQVSRDFKVTLENLAVYSQLVKRLLQADIDNLSGITFDTSHRNEDENRAMQMAIDDAHQHALEMATQVGAKLGVAYAVASKAYRSFLGQGFPLQSNFDRPVPGVMVQATARTATPDYVVPRSITISYDVTVVYSMRY